MADQDPSSPTSEARDVADADRDAAVVAVNRTASGGLTLQFALDIPRLPSIRAVPTWTHQQLLNGALIAAVGLMALYLVYDHLAGSPPAATAPAEPAVASPLAPNVKTSFNPTVESPVVEPGAFVDPRANVSGHVIIGAGAYVGPYASVRGDEGQPIAIGARSNVQDLVVIHAERTFDRGRMVERNLVTVDGETYAVYIGEDVSVGHQAVIHGPVAIHDRAYVGMQAIVARASIGAGAIVGPGATVVGVDVPEGRMVPAGAVITTQAAADALAAVDPDDPLAQLAESDLDTHRELGGAAPASANATSPGH